MNLYTVEYSYTFYQTMKFYITERYYTYTKIKKMHN